MIFSKIGQLPRHLYCWVDSRFTHEEPIGFVEAMWVGLTSIPGRAWGINVLLRDGGSSTVVYLHTQSTSMIHKKNSIHRNGQSAKPSFGIVTAIISLFFAMTISASAYPPRWETMYCQDNTYFQQPTYWTDIQIVQIRTRNSFFPSWTTVDLPSYPQIGWSSEIVPSSYQPILFPNLGLPR